uniref:glycoprotein endo-alpha-1,2-mannosidase-like protein n=1 Tax=Myxine glutinosa TaxID=7769 RepID=UPI00358E82E1
MFRSMCRRPRRRRFLLLLGVSLLLLLLFLGLRALSSPDMAASSPWPIPGEPPAEAAAFLSENGASADPRASGVNYDIHVFYYTWYGNPGKDGQYLHWNHPLIRHWDPKVAAGYPDSTHGPPEDLASSFYPELGPYSSRDPQVLDSHMHQIRQACAGVLVISWYPLGMADDHGRPTDDLVPTIMDAANHYGLKVTFHIEPYKNRNAKSVHNDIKYIIDSYGKHPAFYRYKRREGRLLPLFYIYDSYLTEPEMWSAVLSHSGSNSLRGTPHDAVVLALLVDQRHLSEIDHGGFDGAYTYFASNGFSYGASQHNWPEVRAFCEARSLLFVPSVGPGYVDTRVRPWNGHHTRHRVHGQYYEAGLQAALLTRPELVSLTSFNEWHEGTQIERALPHRTTTYTYLDYAPASPDLYLQLTSKWAKHYREQKRQWLM